MQEEKFLKEIKKKNRNEMYEVTCIKSFDIKIEINYIYFRETRNRIFLQMHFLLLRHQHFMQHGSFWIEKEILCSCHSLRLLYRSDICASLKHCLLVPFYFPLKFCSNLKSILRTHFRFDFFCGRIFDKLNVINNRGFFRESKSSFNLRNPLLIFVTWFGKSKS